MSALLPFSTGVIFQHFYELKSLHLENMGNPTYIHLLPPHPTLSHISHIFGFILLFSNETKYLGNKYGTRI